MLILDLPGGWWVTEKNCQRDVSWLLRSARRLVGDLRNFQVAVSWLIRFARRMGVTYKICRGVGGWLIL